jgi:phage terminase Nu1 subunit (DNA packaging protein)
MTTNNLYSTAELITHLAAEGMGQFARQTITHWTRLSDDPLPVHYRGKRGQGNKYDYQEVVAWLKRRDNSSAPAASYDDERARYMRAKAEIAEMDAAERAGRLVDADDVRKTAYQAARNMRQAFAAMPDRIASELAVIDDEIAISERIRREVDEIMEALNDFDRKIIAEQIAAAEQV